MVFHYRKETLAQPGREEREWEKKGEQRKEGKREKMVRGQKWGK